MLIYKELFGRLMISNFQAIILGLLQGISELFPISSLGHSVIFPQLLGWDIHQNDPFFLDFLVGTHFATALVLFIFFRKDWFLIISGTLNSLINREIQPEDTYAKLGWLLIVGTIPAGLLGLLFEDSLRAFFASARSAAFFLILNGLILFLAEYLRRKAKEESSLDDSDKRLSQLSWSNSLKIGLAQAIALIPGFSRTGSSMVGGLLVGLSHEDAARFSFLLATPIIGAAALLKLPELFLFNPVNQQLIIATLIGAICSAISAFIAVKFLVKYFQTQTLMPFAIYCLGVGTLVSLLLYFR